MATDYIALREENKGRYGSDIGRWGYRVLVNRYDDRAHFIFELIQNAEDALRKRRCSGEWKGPRSLSFELSHSNLRVSHYGELFTPDNVRAICGIDDSTKEITAIGRFGIGFKSVYAFTNRPEIHSGDEHFAIDSYVLPAAVPPIGSEPDETAFVLPFRDDDPNAASDIAAGLRRLGARSLLFLREIEAIEWTDVEGTTATYLRQQEPTVVENARKIKLLGCQGEDTTDEVWIAFSRPVEQNGVQLGYAEIAYQIEARDGVEIVTKVADSRLVAFFPTVLSTNLGFLVQGPYQTTPSRDNVPIDEPWNRYLAEQTAGLVAESLHGLKKLNLLSVDSIAAMPLDKSKFGSGSLFLPCFEAVRSELLSQPLIPCVGETYQSAKTVRLARGQGLRELFDSPKALKTALGAESDIHWVSDEITADRSSDVRSYLVNVLGVREYRLDTIIPVLKAQFLETQHDAWIEDLYVRLCGRTDSNLASALKEAPIIRLVDGTHVAARSADVINAYLPSANKTEYPTVRRSVCGKEQALKFLKSLDLREPDPVDDVINNLLPKLKVDGYAPSTEEYSSDINRILGAFRTDSKSRRDALVAELRWISFVGIVDCGTGEKSFERPYGLYLPTQRLKDLFRGVSGVAIVDDTISDLRGEAIRDLLEACGATPYLQQVPNYRTLDYDERLRLRVAGGETGCSQELSTTDYNIHGLQNLLEFLQTLETAEATIRSQSLWDALCDLEDRRGSAIFNGTYEWFYRKRYSQQFPATFVNQLKQTPWIPNPIDGTLQIPSSVVFEDLGWQQNPFLQSRIPFLPSTVKSLAEAAGLEPAVIALLKTHGLTTVDQLMKLLPTTTPPVVAETEHPIDLSDAKQDSSSHPTLGDPDKNIEQETPASDDDDTNIGGTYPGSSSNGGSGGGGGRKGGTSNGTHGSSTSSGTGSASGSRPFHSYIGVGADDSPPDPDNLDHAERLALEEAAIAFILKVDPDLQRTSQTNPGFDLFESVIEGGEPIRWVEVKAMKSDLRGRAVGLSREQFECCRRHGSAYWLYVVENAASPGTARLIKINDPAGHAKYFTFDHGWTAIAEIVENAEH